MEYDKLPIACDLSYAALQDAARRVGPSFVYTLHVGPSDIFDAVNILRQFNAHVNGNPLAPHINLVTDADLDANVYCAWFLEANGKRFGSEGWPRNP